MEFMCFPSPLLGCADPGAEVGTPLDDCEANDPCRPDCLITDIHLRGTSEERQQELPPCLEICPDGPCPDNEDPALAWRANSDLDPKTKKATKSILPILFFVIFFLNFNNNRIVDSI